MILVTLPQVFLGLVASGITLVSQPLFAKCAIDPEYYASKHLTGSAAIPAAMVTQSGPFARPNSTAYQESGDDRRGHERERDGAAPLKAVLWPTLTGMQEEAASR
jgi:hypothetical protein